MEKGVPQVSNVPDQDMEKPGRRGRQTYYAALSLGTNMAAAFAVFGGLGYWMDRGRGRGPFWTVCGLLFAMAFCMYEVWKLVRRLDEEERAKKRKSERDEPRSPA